MTNLKLERYYKNICLISNFKVPTRTPTDVEATPCKNESLCLLVSWKSLPASYVESLNGVFQGYTVLYRGEGEPFQDLFVSPQENEIYEAQLKNLKGYTNYTIQVLVVTLSGIGFPSSPITALSGESGKQRYGYILKPRLRPLGFYIFVRCFE